jgi:hypothetical protein
MVLENTHAAQIFLHQAVRHVHQTCGKLARETQYLCIGKLTGMRGVAVCDTL